MYNEKEKQIIEFFQNLNCTFIYQSICKYDNVLCKILFFKFKDFIFVCTLNTKPTIKKYFSKLNSETNFECIKKNKKTKIIFLIFEFMQFSPNKVTNTVSNYGENNFMIYGNEFKGIYDNSFRNNT